MPERIVTVIGIGNLRCGSLVLATLCRWYPDVPISVRLFDSNEERLDLMDMLGRQLFDLWNSEVRLSSGSDLAESMDGATDLIVCLNEDCSRRMVGGNRAESLDFFEETQERSFFGGDPNKPTPVENLSDHTKRILGAPVQQGSTRQEVILEAFAKVRHQLSPPIRIVSLMRDVELKTDLPITQLSWPEPLTELQVATKPFQILRWVKGDEKVEDLIERINDNPLMEWLKAGEE
ncbi:MAG: hypothetical protein KF836_09140 [Fimbriimonadaceae bacterium]|nr:hypothetical protein [Fimbriimonadaceae bacterium]